MKSLLRVLNKPEYFFNPKQLAMRALQFFKNSPKGEVKASLFGGDFSYLYHDDIGRALHSFGLYDLCVSEALWRLVEPGATVLDIGANIGYFSSLLSKKVGESGKVYSFEPNPQILELLKKNTRAKSNVKLLPWALSDEDGIHTLYGPQSYSENKGLASLNTKNGEAIATVDVKRLDDLRLTPAVIKMDVEGHELKVLEGGRATL
ncbi:MAG: FkbM family methyltransferase, partial [Bdellovibrionaceae bacterium]|nr:FkbM family methyltransferase [Pseudobdellovibrionaceae bacterium]